MIITYLNDVFANLVGKKNMKLPTKVTIERFSGHISREECVEMIKKPTELHFEGSLVGKNC